MHSFVKQPQPSGGSVYIVSLNARYFSPDLKMALVFVRSLYAPVDSAI